MTNKKSQSASHNTIAAAAANIAALFSLNVMDARSFSLVLRVYEKKYGGKRRVIKRIKFGKI